MQRCRAVDDRNACANGRHAFRARDHRDARHGLAYRVITDLVAIRTELSVCSHIAHDAARVERFQRLIAEAHLVDGAGAEVLYEHVRHFDQLAQGGLPVLHAQVHAHALLAAVVLHPVGTLLPYPRRVVTRLLAANAFDLDDFRAQPRHHLRASRSCLMTAEIDHTDAAQWSIALCHASLLSCAHVSGRSAHTGRSGSLRSDGRSPSKEFTSSASD